MSYTWVLQCIYSSWSWSSLDKIFLSYLIFWEFYLYLCGTAFPRPFRPLGFGLRSFWWAFLAYLSEVRPQAWALGRGRAFYDLDRFWGARSGYEQVILFKSMLILYDTYIPLHWYELILSFITRYLSPIVAIFALLICHLLLLFSHLHVVATM